jgi:hypothetical protein
MNDLHLNAAGLQPSRQPKAIASRLMGKGNPLNPPAALYPLSSPTLQRSLQCCRIRLKLLQWSTVNAGNQAGDQPTRLAHLDDRYHVVSWFSSMRERLKSSAWGMGPTIHLLCRAARVSNLSRLPHSFSSGSR